jgi:3-phenylpropionate/trans-cinnamate dioxygenase ferredoxin reductase component
VSAVPASVAVVGAGVAGVAVCEELRARGYDGRIVLYGAEDRAPYDRPPLSKDFLLGTASAADLLLRSADWYARHAVDLRRGVRVQRILPDEGRTVDAAGREEPAEAIVLATGARARRPAVPGAGHGAVGVLRTVEDALALRARLGPGARLAVLGAGLIGAEVAAAASALGCAVALVDPDPLPLARAVGPRIADLLREQHRAHGVRVLTDTVARIEDRGRAAALVLAGGAVLECDAVLAGIGAEPETGPAAEAGLALDGGVLVDAAQRTTHPRVFAVGDAARRREGGGPGASGHWDAAVTQARTAVAALLGLPAPPDPVPWFWSDRYGTRLEVAGVFAGAEATVLRGSPGVGPFCALALRGGLCVGAVSLDRPRDMAAARRLIERRVPLDAAAAADESVGLRSLLRS